MGIISTFQSNVYLEMGLKSPPKDLQGLPFLVQGPCNPPYLLALENPKKSPPVIFDEIFEDYEVVFNSCHGNKCCESSVAAAKKSKGLILKLKFTQCPDAWEQDTLRCEDSRKWCMPLR